MVSREKEINMKNIDAKLTVEINGRVKTKSLTIPRPENMNGLLPALTSLLCAILSLMTFSHGAKRVWIGHLVISITLCEVTTKILDVNGAFPSDIQGVFDWLLSKDNALYYKMWRAVTDAALAGGQL